MRKQDKFKQLYKEGHSIQSMMDILDLTKIEVQTYTTKFIKSDGGVSFRKVLSEDESDRMRQFLWTYDHYSPKNFISFLNAYREVYHE